MARPHRAIVKRQTPKIIPLVPRIGPAELDPPDAAEAECEAVELEDWEMRNDLPAADDSASKCLAGMGLAVALVVLATLTSGPMDYRPPGLLAGMPIKIYKPVASPRLIYPLPELKGKVWDPVVHPPPRWIRVGSFADGERSHS